MERDGRTRRALLAAGAGLATLAGCLGAVTGGQGDGGGSTDPTLWRRAELTAVRTGETFTVEELDKPVLLETFAVWCSTCLAQQREIRALSNRVGENAVVPVSLDIDPNEDADAVSRHAEKHGFEWRYAVSPPAVTDSLVAAFGESMTVPPRAPVVLVCADGTRRLPDGVKSADDLEAATETGC